MRKFIGILKFYNGTRILVNVEAKSKAEAFLKIAKYSAEEGYYPDEIEVIESFDGNGIIEI